jgi:hypothetical protein
MGDYREQRTELVHVRALQTMVALMKLREKFHEAVETAECGLAPGSCCPEPKPVEACRWSTTKFCGARLRDEARAGELMDADMERREREERAETCCIPRLYWTLCGVSSGSKSGLVNTAPLSFLHYSWDRKLVVLQGPDGTGKTVAAAYWCWRRRGWYYRATNLRWWQRGGGYNRDPGDGRLLSAPVVAIVGLDKPWAAKDGAHRHNLIHVLHERLDAAKTTLITTNMAWNDVESALGPSLFRLVNNWHSIAKLDTVLDGSKEIRGEQRTF